ncbi:AraC family transcriptional regulator [Sulfurimonas sp. C5]|uniref:AraC family transcriptional regulator n=1 Tax=Sulfurimonas sp. C5 TaxID=3036947 RepID=UPI002457977A|nr:AraC family transcriptional regulator [Sulfurimonas sp. C5]MDH4944149.1 AraC family transcriptional regulator [Sulfurimonas sp. C5]
MNNMSIQNYREELKDIIKLRYTDDNLITTQIDQLTFYYRSDPTDMLETLYEPSVCIILQGSKEVGLGDELIPYDEDMYLLASIHMPAQVRVVKASLQQPYIGLTITFTMEQIFEVLKEMPPVAKQSARSQRGLYFGDMKLQLLESVTRLVRLLDSPEDISVLSPLIIKEILYTVMRDEGGDVIRQYVQDGSSEQRIVQAITRIKDKYNQPLNVKELARTLSMSESSLYHSFKKMTAMSPLQFQKKLRLQEARQMLLTQNIEAAQVAFEVGYESPSQFSREFSRMFGLAPKTYAVKNQKIS